MITIALDILRYSTILVFGVAVSLLIAGVPEAQIAKFSTVILNFWLLLLQLFCWRIFGLQTTSQLYPFITHLPLILFLVFYYKRPVFISISSVLTAYLCCQIPQWISTVTESITGRQSVVLISYIATTCIVYYFLRRYMVSSIRALLERSTRACLLFGAVPLLYYLFDYATTVYTDLLYTGAREAVHFTPSLICIFYLVFILLYNNESQKQIEAQRERDLFSSQLQQSKLELDKMRQMQSNTIIYRHDMRHHLSLIGGFVAEGDLQKIKEYLANTEADIDALTPVRYCENETVNLIISSFVARAKKEDVDLQADVRIPRELGLNDTELCSLLSNALENAITAAAQLEDEKLRKVFFRGTVNKANLIFSTENAYSGELEMEGEIPKSKKQAPGHGFGIKSMISLLERYGGLYSIETKDGVFSLRLMLPLIKE